MKVLIVEPNSPPRAAEIEPTLSAMQSVVGGLIQAIYPFPEPVALVCNDEGKLLNLPPNRPLRHPDTGEIYDRIAGTFFLCAAPQDSENFESLSEEQITHYTKYYQLPDHQAEPETQFTCSVCGKAHPVANRTVLDGQMLCSSCLENSTLVCAHCGKRIWRDSNAGSQEHPLCSHCFEHHYTICARCGRLLRNSEALYEDDDNDNSFCQTCYQSASRDKAIHDYYFKPAPIFYGTGPRYFGVELEVDGAGEDRDNARKVLEIANQNRNHLYIKHDGSLDDGMELVTHPMSLDYHCTEMPWSEILTCLKEMGYTSHQAGTCGLHAHISRAAFGQTEAEQDAAIARVLFFVEKHWDEILKFSRRTPRQLDRWAARYGYKEQPKDILDHAKKGHSAGRYVCVNLLNEDTIEFRLFRGTLKLNTFVATLQFIDRICDVALFLSDDEIKSMSWTTFVSGCTQPELVQYLKERRLYLNEPVDGEVEI